MITVLPSRIAMARLLDIQRNHAPGSAKFPADLIQRAQQGTPLPEPAGLPGGLVLAPAAARPHPLDRLAISWLHPGP